MIDMAEQVLTSWQVFGAELRRLRLQRGMTLEELSQRTGYGSSTISKTERAIRAPKRDYVEAMGAAFGTSTELLRMWSSASKSESDPDWYRKVVSSEEQASEIRMWHPTLVPGFLQTKDYARVIFRDGRPFDVGEQLDQLADLRATRLKALQEGQNPRILAIISEQVIRTTVGSPEIMKDQLQHLVDLADSGGVQTLILPLDTP